MNKNFLVYRVYYGDTIVYVGRTKQKIQDRIHGHLFAKPMHRVFNIDCISKVEYHEFQTEADMNLYEIYYILTLHPSLNVDDKTRDFPTVKLPEVEFTEARFSRWDAWKNQIHHSDETETWRRRRKDEIRVAISALRFKHACGEISDDEYWDRKDLLGEELKSI